MKEYTEVADEAAEDKANIDTATEADDAATIDAAQVKVDEEIAAEDAEQPTLLDDAV